MTDEFKILSDREHCLLRPGMYIGNTKSECYETFILGEWVEASYSPGLLKIINEVIDNSVDENTRTKGKFANQIDVSISKLGMVVVRDNGRGIPQDVISTPSGEQIIRPVAAWTRTKAGSNFDEASRVGMGMNGIGSSITNFFSVDFKGETCDGKRMVAVTCKDNCGDISVSEYDSKVMGTTVTFTPDMERFENTTIDDTVVNLIKTRLELLQLCHPKIKFTFNTEKLTTTTIKKYANKFNPVNITGTSKNIKWFITPSGDAQEFRTMASVNGLICVGDHVNWFVNNLAKMLIPLIKKNYKVDIPVNAIRSGINLGLFVQNFDAPDFDSQTKERFKSTDSKVKRFFKEFKLDDVCNKILKTEEIITPIIDIYLAKKETADRLAAARLAKENKRKPRVEGHVKANKKGGTFFLVEGLSAIGYLVKVRDKDQHGGFPLKGKVKNVHKHPIKDILSNIEYVNIMGCLNLDLSKENACMEEHTNFYMVDDYILNLNDEIYKNGKWNLCSEIIKKDKIIIDNESRTKYNNQDNNIVRRVTNMYYNEVHIMCDADVDGISIFTGLLNFFWRWKDLFTSGRIKIVRSPIIIATNKTDDWFYDMREWNASKKIYSKVRYIKGLGSLTEDEYSKCINDAPRYVISVDDPTNFDLLYSKGKVVGSDETYEDLRKKWLIN